MIIQQDRIEVLGNRRLDKLERNHRKELKDLQALSSVVAINAPIAARILADKDINLKCQALGLYAKFLDSRMLSVNENKSKVVLIDRVLIEFRQAVACLNIDRINKAKLNLIKLYSLLIEKQFLFIYVPHKDQHKCGWKLFNLDGKELKHKKQKKEISVEDEEIDEEFSLW